MSRRFGSLRQGQGGQFLLAAKRVLWHGGVGGYRAYSFCRFGFEGPFGTGVADLAEVVLRQCSSLGEVQGFTGESGADPVLVDAAAETEDVGEAGGRD